jgi:hypothetical protein
VRWTTDGWAHIQDGETKDIGFGRLRYLDIPTHELAVRSRVEWTFFWLESNEWEDAPNFAVEIV